MTIRKTNFFIENSKHILFQNYYHSINEVTFLWYSDYESFKTAFANEEYIVCVWRVKSLKQS
jgi:hypothetical protein